MPFSISILSHLSIIIYPNSSDTWDISSPFPTEVLGMGETAFVISTASVCNDGSLHLVPVRFSEAGTLLNEVDFLIKTLMESKSTAESSGIGGLSKLKDFSFSVIKDNGSVGGNMLLENILALIGRTIVVVMGIGSNEIEDVSNPVTERILFKGKISKPNIGALNIEFEVKGLLNTCDDFVGGEKVENSDGSIVSQAIVFGDCGELLVPLTKKIDGNKITLQFPQSGDYIIKDLYVKASSGNEPTYGKVNTSFNIVNGEVVFNTPLSTNLVLMKNIPAGMNILQVNGHWEIGIIFTIPLTYVPVTNEVCDFQLRTGAGESIYTTNKFIYQRSETFLVGSVSTIVHFFICGWESIFGFIHDIIEAGSYVTGGKTYYPQIFFGLGKVRHQIDYTIVGEVQNPVEKEIDALPYDGSSWRFEELKEEIQKRDTASIKQFQTIPPHGLVIKIDNEQMLIIYSEKNSSEPTSESATGSPSNSLIWVIRGFNNTVATSHLSGAPIIVMVDSLEQIFYTIERELQSLNTMSPSGDFSFFNISEFLNGIKNLEVKNWGGKGMSSGNHDPVAYIGLDWKLPELSGDIYKLYMTGKAYCKGDITSGSFPNYCSITMALNPKEDIETDYDYRRFFGGMRIPLSISNKMFLSKYFDYNGILSPDYIQGGYIFDLETSWLCTTRVDAVSKDYYLGAKGEQASPITDFSELKELNFFIIFNSNVTNTKKSTFSLTRPILNIILKSNLKDVDVYAQLIPKSLFANPKETYDVGDNCRIALFPEDNKILPILNIPSAIAVSDDNLKYFGYIKMLHNASFGGKIFSSDVPNSGYLTTNIHELFDIGKIYPTEGKCHYVGSYGLQQLNYVPSGLFDVGRELVDGGNYYVWVDPVAKKLKLVEKTSVDNSGNPVNIIEQLFTTYAPELSLDATSLAKAKLDRADWRARILIEDEIKLSSLVDLIAKEHGLIVNEGNDGKIFITAISIPVPDAGYPVITLHDIILNKNGLSYKEEFTHIEYLITKMDVYYNYIDKKYKNLIESDKLSCKHYLEEAKEFTDTDIKIKLNLKTIFDEATALKIAELKSFYHKSPTRIIEIDGLLTLDYFNIGAWNTISGGVPEISGKIYLVLGKSEQPPYINTKPKCKLTIFEYDWSVDDLRIQEVPVQDLLDDYDEVPDTTTDYDEIPNV
jgi:hypothetical protein